MPASPDEVLICVPCLCVGGTEMHTLALARALVQAGYGVTVCAYYEYDPSMVRELEQTGASVRLLRLTRNRRGKNLGAMPKLARALAKVVREERPHFVHVQYMAPGWVPIVVARLCGVPRVLATVHVPGRHYGRRIWMPRCAARLCDAFLCVSEDAEKSFFGSSALLDEALLRRGRRHFTIHNAVDLQEADELLASGLACRKRRQLEMEGHLAVGVIGRVSPEKGHRWLLEAMREVVCRVPSARLLVVGDGADRPALTVHAEANGLKDRVVWAGRVPRREALACFGAVDVVVVPSLWEGFGLSAAEAMAFKRPVVASDVDGLREVVEDGVTGRLVRCGDVPGMAEALVHILEDRDTCRDLGVRGRERAERLFSHHVFADRHRRLYRSLAGTARADADCHIKHSACDTARVPEP